MTNIGLADHSGKRYNSGARQYSGLLVFHLALLLATIAPMLSVEIPPLGDFPNHLARLHILANLKTVPALKENYEVVWTLTPYLLVDWMLTPLTRIWSVYDVGRAFIVASMVVTYGGVLLLSVMFSSRLTVWPALALPILYNYAFSWGFMSFSFGVGLMFWAFALWLRQRSRSALHRLVTLLCLSVAFYLVHMLVFGLFAVVVSAHGLSVAYRRRGPRAVSILRELMVVIPPFGLTLAVYVFWLANDGTVGEKITRYGSPIEKVAALISPTMFSNSMADWALLAAYSVGAVFLFGRGKLKVAENMAFPLSCFAVISLIMPDTLFGVWGVDFRLPPVLLMLLIACARPTVLADRPARPVAMIVIAALVLVRVVSLWPQLRIADRQFLEFRNAVSEISEGSRVLVSIEDPTGKFALPQRAYWNIALIAVIERNAFLPMLFTETTQVRPTARNRDLNGPGGALQSEDLVSGLDPEFIAQNRNRKINAYDRIYWAAWPEHFDYLVRINPVAIDGRVTAELEDIAHHSFFDIGKIRKPN